VKDLNAFLYKKKKKHHLTRTTQNCGSHIFKNDTTGHSFIMTYKKPENLKILSKNQNFKAFVVKETNEHAW